MKTDYIFGCSLFKLAIPILVYKMGWLTGYNRKQWYNSLVLMIELSLRLSNSSKNCVLANFHHKYLVDALLDSTNQLAYFLRL
jgi:hypothetical protein